MRGEHPRRARRAAFAAFGGLAALPLAACGGGEDYENDPPRAAASIQVAARVDAKEVVVSPDSFGAGLVNFTVLNSSDSPITFTLSGPKEATTDEIPPGAPGDLKVELPEGSYEASAGEGSSAQPETVLVGPGGPAPGTSSWSHRSRLRACPSPLLGRGGAATIGHLMSTAPDSSV